MHRTRRGFSLSEIALVLVLLSVVLALTAPRLITANQASSARNAQSSLELTATAAVDYRAYTGTTPSTAAALADLVPAVTLIDGALASTDPDQVSIAASGDAVVLTADDGEGACWVLIRHLVPSGALDEVKIVRPGADCDADGAVGFVGATPTTGTGASWSEPWSA